MMAADCLDQLAYPDIYRAIGLCLLAHIYELKVAVCLLDNNVCFTAQNCSKVKECDIFLHYIGVCKFVFSVPKDTDKQVYKIQEFDSNLLLSLLEFSKSQLSEPNVNEPDFMDIPNLNTLPELPVIHQVIRENCFQNHLHAKYLVIRHKKWKKECWRINKKKVSKFSNKMKELFNKHKSKSDKQRIPPKDKCTVAKPPKDKGTVPKPSRDKPTVPKSPKDKPTVPKPPKEKPNVPKASVPQPSGQKGPGVKDVRKTTFSSFTRLGKI